MKITKMYSLFDHAVHEVELQNGGIYTDFRM